MRHDRVYCVIVDSRIGCKQNGGNCRHLASLRNMRTDMYFNIQDFSFANIDKFSTAGLVTRLTTDVVNIQNAFMMIIRVAVRGPFMIVFALVMAFTISARIASMYLLLIPILGLALAALILFARRYFERVFEQYDRLNQVVQENLSGIRVVKGFAREEYEKEKFQKTSTLFVSYLQKGGGHHGLFLTRLCRLLFIPVCCLFAG